MNLAQLNQLPIEIQAIVAIRDLAAGQILFAQHEPSEAFFILESGDIQLLSYTEDGTQINHYGVRAGESFAEVALFYSHFLCTAIANTTCRVLVVPKEPYLMALRSHPDLAEAFMARLAQRLHESKLLLELRGIRPAEKRVLHYLRLNLPADSLTVDLNLPLKTLAGDLGLSPEALSRALKKLHEEGIINRMKRRITLC